MMQMHSELQIAVGHHTAGRLAEAEKIYRSILGRDPNEPDALHLLGLIVSQVGRADAAVELIERAIALRPSVGGYNENLGHACVQLGQLDRARAAYLRATELSPNSFTAFYNLGNFLRGLGEHEAALAAYRKSVSINPDFGQAQNNMGLTLTALGQIDEAIAALKRADELLPDSPETKTSLGLAYFESGRQAEALELFDRVVELDPRSPMRASNRVYAKHYDPASDPMSLLNVARQWDEVHGNPIVAASVVHANERLQEKKLRVGYVSADLRDHVVGQHIQPLFLQHDRERFELFVYSNAGIEDGLSRMLATHCAGWRNISRTNDAQTAAIIRGDKIDVLVDLALHSEGNRLGVFAHRPAPVQISFFGYCSTTGLRSMGWRLSDPWIDPPGADPEETSAKGALRFARLPEYVERTIVLPSTHLSYQPPALPLEVSELPALASGCVTFGSLNNFAKVTGEALDVWARILAAVPGSRLIIHSKAGSHRDVARLHFERAGIAGDRIEFVGRQSRKDYFLTYSRIDIALDTFPYSGGITTCDALWMGVPVITMRGRTAVGRVATSILANAGLSEFSTGTVEEYQAKAIAVAGDLPRLGELRKSLRDKMRNSATMDGAKYAHEVESAYRHAWREFCSSTSV
jgi:protein O-GlcNAc transferase